MKKMNSGLKHLWGASALALIVTTSSLAVEGDKTAAVQITEQPLAAALAEFSRQTDIMVVAPTNLTRGKMSGAVTGDLMPVEALRQLLEGSGLKAEQRENGAFTISKAELKDAGAYQAQGSEADAGEPAFVLEEIIVTATRRAESLQDVGLAVSALGTAAIERQGIENFADFARSLPGVVLTENAKHYGKFTIRGLQPSTTYSGNANKTVSVYVDDVPVTALGIVTPDIRLYDIERVEVLRGPQGTLFGSSSMGGAVRIITKKPDLSGFDASAKVDFGLTGDDSFRQRYNAMVNIPLADEKLALRLVGYYRNEEGYVDNVGVGIENSDASEDWGVRGALRWEPSELFSATLKIMKDESTVDDLSLVDPSLGKRTRNSLWQDATWVDTTQYNLTMEYDFGGANLISVSTLSNMDQRFMLGLDQVLGDILPIGYHQFEAVETKMQELRLISDNDSPLQWVVGGFYLKQDKSTPIPNGLVTLDSFLDDLNITGLAQNTLAGNYDLGNQFTTFFAEELAAYAEVSWRFTDSLKLTGGLRYTKANVGQGNVAEGYDATGAVIGAVLDGGNVDIDTTQFPQAASEIESGSKSKLTPKISLTWEATEDQTYYLLAAQGFRAPFPNLGALVNGGRSPLDPNDPVVIPAGADFDTLWNYEVGAKTTWMNGRIKANIALYYIKWTNMQLPLTRLSDAYPYQGNVGESVSKGIEAEFTARPTEALDVGLNMTVQSAKFSNLSEEEELATGAKEGWRLSSPNFQLSGHVQYTWALDNGQDLYARLDAQHIGSYPNGLPNVAVTGDANPFFNDIPSYENVNASVGWVTDKWTVTLYGENIFNDNTFIAINPATHSISRFATLRPRTIGIRASWRY